MTSVSVITPEDVLETLMNDGTVDSIRLKIINQLRADEELKSTTVSMVEQSKILNTPGSQKLSKRNMLDALRQELESTALEKASEAIWELIHDNNGLGPEINGTVERVFRDMSGCELPLFPPSNSDAQSEKIRKKRKLVKGKEILGSTVEKNKGKRTFNAMSTDEALEDSVQNSKDESHDVQNIDERERTRCNRSDGKSWRCSNDALPDCKYCERHDKRGTRSKKRKETNSEVVANMLPELDIDFATSEPDVPDTNLNDNSRSNAGNEVSSRNTVRRK